MDLVVMARSSQPGSSPVRGLLALADAVGDAYAAEGRTGEDQAGCLGEGSVDPAHAVEVAHLVLRHGVRPPGHPRGLGTLPDGTDAFDVRGDQANQLLVVPVHDVV